MGVDWQTSRDGKQWAKFSVLVEQVNYNGDREEFCIPIVAFGKTAEMLQEIRRGQLVSVACEVRSREYQEKHYLDLSASRISALVGNREAQPSIGKPMQAEDVSFEDDDIPF